ncbi:MAG: TIGR03013 family XrtA/PEP-CTERM system glycosyltransferase [Geobacteraceae bacterium]|nr:TIGR03013 family XrtA/PEP-CTERM system glycosyltransferase [Geobacteraceae bacterium]
MTRMILILIAGDIVCSLSALSIAMLPVTGKVFGLVGQSPGGSFNRVLFTGVLLFSSFVAEVYRDDREMGGKEIAIRIVVALCCSLMFLSSLYYLLPSAKFGRIVLVSALAFFGVIQFAWHVFVRIKSNLPVFAKRVLILGAGPLAKRIGGLISARNSNYILTGYVNCTSESVNVPYQSIVGDFENLYETVKKKKANKVVVSLSERRGVFPLQDMLNCKLSGIEVLDAPSFYEKVTGKLLLENITPSWFIFSHGFRSTLLFRLAKRMIDVVMSLAGLLMFLPFFPVLAVLMRLDSPGPLFFSQERVGEGEKPFTIYKFRTMRQDAEDGTGAVWARRNDPRITKLGSFLRKSRIDEIPQLFNVLLGEMSLVGPRPERPEFVEELKKIIPYYSERHFVKPGVTGWAQVCYPYGSSVEDALEKLRYDLYYTKNISFGLDVRVILKTIGVVLLRRGR